MARRGQREWTTWEFSPTAACNGDGTTCMCVTVKFAGKRIGKIYRERGMDGWAGDAQLEGILEMSIEGDPLKETKESI